MIGTKTDGEVLHEYIDKYDKAFYEKLSPQEKIMYACLIRDTLDFTRYLLRHRLRELFYEICESLKGIFDFKK